MTPITPAQRRAPAESEDEGTEPDESPADNINEGEQREEEVAEVERLVIESNAKMARLVKESSAEVERLVKEGNAAMERIVTESNADVECLMEEGNAEVCEQKTAAVDDDVEELRTVDRMVENLLRGGEDVVTAMGNAGTELRISQEPRDQMGHVSVEMEYATAGLELEEREGKGIESEQSDAATAPGKGSECKGVWVCLTMCVCAKGTEY